MKTEIYCFNVKIGGQRKWDTRTFAPKDILLDNNRLDEGGLNGKTV